ncbi:TPA: prepilin peptidase [Vibrio parahaemolyticus]
MISYLFLVITGSLVAKITYVIAGLLPQIEEDEIRNDLITYYPEYSLEPSNHEGRFDFTSLCKSVGYWVPFSCIAGGLKGNNQTYKEVFVLEITVAATTVTLYQIATSFEQFLLMLIFFCLTAMAFLVDLASQFLPEKLTNFILWSGLVLACTEYGYLSSEESLSGALLGYGLLYLFNTMHKVLYKNIGMANGDLRLGAGIGAWAGVEITMLTILFMFVFIVITYIRGTRGQYPLGPYIVISSYIAFIVNNPSFLTINF